MYKFNIYSLVSTLFEVKTSRIRIWLSAQTSVVSLFWSYLSSHRVLIPRPSTHIHALGVDQSGPFGGGRTSANIHARFSDTLVVSTHFMQSVCRTCPPFIGKWRGMGVRVNFTALPLHPLPTPLSSWQSQRDSLEIKASIHQSLSDPCFFELPLTPWVQSRALARHPNRAAAKARNRRTKPSSRRFSSKP